MYKEALSLFFYSTGKNFTLFSFYFYQKCTFLLPSKPSSTMSQAAVRSESNHKTAASAAANSHKLDHRNNAQQKSMSGIPDTLGFPGHAFIISFILLFYPHSEKIRFIKKLQQRICIYHIIVTSTHKKRCKKQYQPCSGNSHDKSGSSAAYPVYKIYNDKLPYSSSHQEYYDEEYHSAKDVKSYSHYHPG